MEKSPRLDREDHAVAQPLKNGSFVYVHHGTSRVTAKIAFPEKRPLGAGQKKIAQLKLASPMFAFVGDHFVVRDSSEQCTIAGGIVLNPDGDRESLTSTAASYDVDSLARLMISQRGFAQPENLLSKSQFSADEISEALVRLQKRKEIILRQHVAVDAEVWQKLTTQAAQLIYQAHKQNPERAGVDRDEMHAALRIVEP